MQQSKRNDVRGAGCSWLPLSCWNRSATEKCPYEQVLVLPFGSESSEGCMRQASNSSDCSHAFPLPFRFPSSIILASLDTASHPIPKANEMIFPWRRSDTLTLGGSSAPLPSLPSSGHNIPRQSDSFLPGSHCQQDTWHLSGRPKLWQVKLRRPRGFCVTPRGS